MSVESPQSDADLLEAVRGGNAAAYGVLYERHVVAARALARQLVRGETDVEDVVAESFTKILDLVGRGGGPDAGFRPYLLTVVRRTVYDRGRVESRQVSTGEIELFDPGVPFVDPALTGLEKSLISRAFLSLPDRWRTVLWHTEVEDSKAAEVGPLLGLSANGVAALAYRAREGLRQAYLQMHLAASPQQACRPVLGKMGAYVRGGLARRDSKSVDDHVSGCAECNSVLLELTDVNRGLRVIVGPLFVGPVFAGYLAALAKASAAAGGAGAGVIHALGWIRRAPKSQQAAVAGTVAAGVAVAAFLLVSGEEPIKKPPVAAAPSPSSQASPAVEPPSEKPARKPEPEPTPTPTPTTSKPGRAKLSATIGALGSLVRAQPGIIGIRLRNAGKGPSDELAATVALPEGVTLITGGSRGSSVTAVKPVGTVDGWSCKVARRGAQCVRRPLRGGSATAVFLRVRVAASAPEGAGPAVRIKAGGVQVKAVSPIGVREDGAPARFATDGKVVVRAVGNALLTCPPSRQGCPEALRRQGQRRDNDLWTMQPLDRDQVASTKASSAARLDLPAGGQIVWAGLYWSASTKTAGPIKFRPAGRDGYVKIRPNQVMARELPVGPAYQAFADVTGLVSSSKKKGMWWAADAPMKPGISQHAGWSLVVIATDPAQPYSQAVVLDTATQIGGEKDAAGRLDVPLGGLIPAAAPARLELVTWEGDADLSGDKVSLGGAAMVPEAGGRDAGNTFDGSSNGANGLTFGVDVDTFSAELGERPRLSIVSRRDAVLFGVAAVSVRARS
ncbi:sigma-70 family RNA polymerase sigma factor [Nonomuraea sp. NPDC050540]|uniref:sigma-70 family RNA polymerase sigma factor n=1 Tax=Nonomuraea sp. NPDC050540 TaxID=3364367 RepID=UPI00378FE3A5